MKVEGVKAEFAVNYEKIGSNEKIAVNENTTAAIRSKSFFIIKFVC